MAKKQTSSLKKTTDSKKKASASLKKQTSSAGRTTASAGRTAASPKARAAVSETPTVRVLPHGSGAAHEHRMQLLPVDFMGELLTQIKTLSAEFNRRAENNLTPLQRQRKKGPGVRIYGFIEEVSDLAAVNPRYVNYFDPHDLENCVLNVEMCRNLAVELQAFARMAANTMLVYSNDGYDMALFFYHTVKGLSRRGDPEAIELYRMLKTFFRKHKRAASGPSVKKAERDARAVLKGKKDGEIVIKGVTPKMSGGDLTVVEDIHRE